MPSPDGGRAVLTQSCKIHILGSTLKVICPKMMQDVELRSAQAGPTSIGFSICGDGGRPCECWSDPSVGVAASEGAAWPAAESF